MDNTKIQLPDFDSFGNATQQAIALNFELNRLTHTASLLREDLEQLALAGQTNSTAYKKLAQAIHDNYSNTEKLRKTYQGTLSDLNKQSQAMANLKARTVELTKTFTALDISVAGSAEKGRQFEKQILSNTQTIRRYEAANTGAARAGIEGHAKLNEKLQDTNKILDDSKKRGENFKSVLSGVAGSFNIPTNLQELSGMVATFAVDAFKLAIEAEGVERAFDRLGGNARHNLNQLREAVKGTQSDLELMQLAIDANKFRIPVEILAKGLAYAKHQADATGESVKELNDKFIKGLGQQSPRILEELGISTNELAEEMNKTGDFAAAVVNIIERKMPVAGEEIESMRDKTSRARVEWEKFTLAMGNMFTDLANWSVDALGAFDTYVKRKVNGYSRLIGIGDWFRKDGTTIVQEWLGNTKKAADGVANAFKGMGEMQTYQRLLAEAKAAERPLKEITQEIQTQQEFLEGLDSNSADGRKAIEATRAKIKELEAERDEITGTAAERRAREREQREKEERRIEEQHQNDLLRVQEKAAELKIENMAEGAAKQRAEAKVQYEKDLSDLQAFTAKNIAEEEYKQAAISEVKRQYGIRLAKIEADIQKKEDEDALKKFTDKLAHIQKEGQAEQQKLENQLAARTIAGETLNEKEEEYAHQSFELTQRTLNNQIHELQTMLIAVSDDGSMNPTFKALNLTPEQQEQLNSQLQTLLETQAKLQAEHDGQVYDKKEEANAKIKALNDQLYVDMANTFAASLGQMASLLGDALSGQEVQLKDFMKVFVGMMIDQVKLVTMAAVAQATGLSIGSPQSVATAGVAGVAQAAILTALIEGAFSAFKAAILSKFAQGGIVNGPSHAQGGIKFITPTGIAELEGGELIVNKNIWQRPEWVQTISAMNAATGGRSFFAQGGVVSAPAPKLPYNASQAIQMQQMQLNFENMAIQIGQQVGRNTHVAVAVNEIGAKLSSQAKAVNTRRAA